MGDRVWQVPQEQFIEIWNSSESLDLAAQRVKEVAGGACPRWAVMARAMDLRKNFVKMQTLPHRPVEG
jgi:hypothetical protein